MKKILEKSGKSQGISSEEKSGNPVLVSREVSQFSYGKYTDINRQPFEVLLF